MLTIPQGVNIREFREKMIEKEIRAGKISRFLDDFLPLLVRRPDPRDEEYYRDLVAMNPPPERALAHARLLSEIFGEDYKKEVGLCYDHFNSLVPGVTSDAEVCDSAAYVAEWELDQAKKFRDTVSEIIAMTRYAREKGCVNANTSPGTRPAT